MVKVGGHGFPEEIGSVEVLINLARRIGNELYRRQADVIAVAKGDRPETDRIWAHKKPDGSSVTSSDIWANDEIYQALRELTPDLNVAIITEEGDGQENIQGTKKEAAYVVDPLDNTGSYKRGELDWSVTIGFSIAGKPTGGVVYYPAQGRLFFTGDDGNSYFLQENTGQLTKLCSSPKSIDDLKSGEVPFVVMTDHDVSPSIPAEDVLYVEEKHGVHTDRYWDIALPSASVDVCEHGDLFYAWDIVAPAAITGRAGAVYLERDGSPLDFFAKRPGHHDFELPRSGFVAGNEQTFRNIGFIKPQEPPFVAPVAPPPAPFPA